MLIGGMNHPERDPVEEVHAMAALGMEFLDLSLEPPAAAPWMVDPTKIRAALADHDMPVVGHTAFYLPLGAAFPEVRRGALNSLLQCVDVFAAIGAKWMNIHPDRYTPFHPRSFFIKNDIESLQSLITRGREVGVGIMIENLPGDFNTVAQLGDLLDPLPELGLHLDIGHCNLDVPANTSDDIVARYGERLKHVHIHDNKGGHADLHLPLGAGTLDFRRHLKALKASGYDGTITLEVFTPDTHYLEYSRDVLRRTWDEL